MNSKVRAVLAGAMLLCSVTLIAFGLFGDFGEFGENHIQATLFPARIYASNSKNSANAAEKEIKTGVTDDYDINDVKANYVVNKESNVFHHPWCSFAENINEENIELVHGKGYELLQQGYKPCGKCNP